MKFRFMIWKMSFIKHETKTDNSEGFIYEEDED